MSATAAAPAERWAASFGAKDTPALDGASFALPPELAASAPPEARGLARDGVRLMVSDARTDRVHHVTFRDLPDFLDAGDLLVVNASATIPAALPARWPAGALASLPVELHLSTPLPGGSPRHWVVELRALDGEGTAPLRWDRPGQEIELAGGGRARLLEPFGASARLWVAELVVPGGVLSFADRHGAPIRYKYVPGRWPIADYQTVFASEPGSAEMPSAGRPFTRALTERLERAGVRIAPLVLHTGVASLENDEAPYPERYRVPRATADAVNAIREAGGRVIAVGTTVVRALETVASPLGRVHPGAGWTELVITPARGVRAVDGILTGLHEPTSSHLAMLEAFAGRPHLDVAYRAALEGRYLWHEFGDAHLMLR